MNPRFLLICGLVCFAVKAQKKNLIAIAPFWVVSHCLTSVCKLQILHVSLPLLPVLSCTYIPVRIFFLKSIKIISQLHSWPVWEPIYICCLGFLNPCVEDIHFVPSVYISVNFSFSFPPSDSSSVLIFYLIVDTGRLLRTQPTNSFQSLLAK